MLSGSTWQRPGEEELAFRRRVLWKAVWTTVVWIMITAVGIPTVLLNRYIVPGTWWIAWPTFVVWFIIWGWFLAIATTAANQAVSSDKRPTGGQWRRVPKDKKNAPLS